MRTSTEPSENPTLYANFMSLCSCLSKFTLTRWPSYTNFTRIPWRYTGCADMNFLRQGFRKLGLGLSSDRHDWNYIGLPHRFAGSQQYCLYHCRTDLHSACEGLTYVRPSLPHTGLCSTVIRQRAEGIVFLLFSSKLLIFDSGLAGTSISLAGHGPAWATVAPLQCTSAS